MMARQIVMAALVVPAMACGLEKLDVDDEGGADGVPPAVQDRFTEYCAIAGCHDGSIQPNLAAGASNAIIGRNSAAGTPYVEFGNLDSEILNRISLPSSNAQTMPPASSARQPADEDRAVIAGWIAGIPFDATDGGTETDDSTTTVASTTMDTTTTTTTSTTGDGSSGPGMDTGSEPTFANVQIEIFDTYCNGQGCHDGTTTPDLSSGSAYDNIVGIPSAQASGVSYIAAGDAANSYIFAKCTGTSEDLGGLATFMPPGAMQTLTPGEVELLQTWINDGAER